MSHRYLTGAPTPRGAPQSQPIPGSSQVPNSAGGFAWQIGSLERLKRFLVLGSEGGSYYATERDLTTENVLSIREALDEHGTVAVDAIIDISKGGRAPKNDPALYALAVAFAHPDIDVRQKAWRGLTAVARTGTHLFHFAEFLESQRGWGRGARRAVQEFYRQDLSKLAYQAVKYRQRDGWTHDDILRLVHPKGQLKNPESPGHGRLFEWITKPEGYSWDPDFTPIIVEGFERAQAAQTPKETAALVREYKLPREALKTEHLNDADVWMAMLEQGMPITALIRNVATMTRNGVIAPFSDGYKLVLESLRNEDKIRQGRVHPIAVLAATMTYGSGHSARGSGTWSPVSQITDALGDAFYLAFGNVEATGKKTMLALDISASMTWTDIAGIPGLRPREGAAAMALVTAAVERDNHLITVFSSRPTGAARSSRSSGWGIAPVDLSPQMRLRDVVRDVSLMPAGGTDCALPILWANEQNVPVEHFAVFTDNETWAGAIHPAQALVAYREKRGIDAKLAVVGMTSNGFSIADPNDTGMLDFVGFDTAAPQVMAEFAKGTI